MNCFISVWPHKIVVDEMDHYATQALGNDIIAKR